MSGQPHVLATLSPVSIRQKAEGGGGRTDVERRKIMLLSGLELRLFGRPACSQSLYRLRYPALSPRTVSKFIHYMSAQLLIGECGTKHRQLLGVACWPDRLRKPQWAKLNMPASIWLITEWVSTAVTL
jgi:hypothetical protein